MSKTIKKTKKQQHIQHHHLLIRCETELKISKNDRSRLETIIDTITNKIKMKKLGGLAFYVDGSKEKSGVTAVNVIETSHIACHIWSFPEKNILHHPKSNNLIQLDIYTCGKLHNYDIINSLELLTELKPTHVDITLLNRKYSLSINKHMSWTKDEKSYDWLEWLNNQKLLDNPNKNRTKYRKN